MRSILLTLAAALLCLATIAQQVPRYGHFVLNPYLVNPAYAGTIAQFPVYLTTRSQWTGLAGSPTSAIASSHISGPQHTGIGGVIQYDKFGGAFTRTSIEGTGAYHIDLNNYDAVSFGLSLAAVQNRFDPSGLNVLNQDDPALNYMQAETSISLDASLGLMIYGSDYYFGLSSPQVMQTKWRMVGPDSSSNRNARHYMIMGGYKYKLMQDVNLHGAGLIRMTGVTRPQVDVNVRGEYKEMYFAGFGYRYKDAVSMLLGGYYFNFMLAYNFEFSASKARYMSPFTHEVTLGYIIKGKRATMVKRNIVKSGKSGPKTLKSRRKFK